MSIRDKIMAASYEAALNNQSLDVYYVTPDEYKELLSETKYAVHDPKPQPPVKASIDSWFTREVEYDHHAPAYLEELASWKARQKQEFGFNVPRFYCPSGIVEIRIKLPEQS